MERYLQCKYLLFFKLSSTSFGIYCLNKLLLLWGIFILKSKFDHIIPGQSPHSFWQNRSFIILSHLPIIASFYPHLQSYGQSFWIIYNSSNKGFSFTSLCLPMCFYFPWNKLSVSYNKFQLILQDYQCYLLYVTLSDLGRETPLCILALLITFYGIYLHFYLPLKRHHNLLIFIAPVPSIKLGS